MSDDLIATLANDLKPVRATAVPLRLAAGLVPGLVAAAILLVAWLGLRSDLVAALGSAIFWVKFGYPLLMAGAGLYATERLSRPGITARGVGVAVAALFLLSAVLGVIQLLTAAPEDTRVLILGGTALVCPFYIVALSAPVFITTILVMRTLAPTRLTLAGLAAGLLAGGAGAWVYSFHCGENGLPFLAIWYTAGMAAAAAIGALSGRYLLRW